MRVCFVFFVCVVLIASAIARPGPGGKRTRRNQPAYDDEIDDREPRRQSHQERLDDFFNGEPIRRNYQDSGRLTKNAAESFDSDDQDDTENSLSDDDDDFFADSDEEDQDDRSDEETGGYDDNEIDDDSRGQSEGRKRAQAPYVPRVLEPEEYDDVDNDVSEQGRRPSPPNHELPRQYDEYEEEIRHNHDSRVKSQGTQSRSDGCVFYCSRLKIGGPAYARLRSMCGCGDYQMPYEK